jgi:NADPH:quinone reductase-like Zn-dependent oxidoreductase
LPCAALTAWSAIVTHGRVQPGDRILVQGTGGVSVFALQFGKLVGAHVTVISGRDDKLARARGLGADDGLNYRQTPEWGKVLRERAGGDGFDHVIDVGGEQTLGQSLRAVRAGGTIALIGVLSGGQLDVKLGPIVTRHVRLQGITVGSRDGFRGDGEGDRRASARAGRRSGVPLRRDARGAALPRSRGSFREDLHPPSGTLIPSIPALKSWRRAPHGCVPRPDTLMYVTDI